jgi:hypothetical protein
MPKRKPVYERVIEGCTVTLRRDENGYWYHSGAYDVTITLPDGEEHEISGCGNCEEYSLSGITLGAMDIKPKEAREE